jgi:hypothetical protein
MALSPREFAVASGWRAWLRMLKPGEGGVFTSVVEGSSRISKIAYNVIAREIYSWYIAV